MFSFAFHRKPLLLLYSVSPSFSLPLILSSIYFLLFFMAPGRPCGSLSTKVSRNLLFTFWMQRQWSRRAAANSGWPCQPVRPLPAFFRLKLHSFKSSTGQAKNRTHCQLPAVFSSREGLHSGLLVKPGHFPRMQRKEVTQPLVLAPCSLIPIPGEWSTVASGDSRSAQGWRRKD